MTREARQPVFGSPFGPEPGADLSSPEQLQEAIRITSPMSRLAVAALTVVVLAASTWSVFGRVRTRVQGDGLIAYQDAQRVEIVAHAEGYLAALLVRRGDRVVRGDVVARIENESIEQRHDLAMRDAEEIRREVAALARERDTDIEELTRFVEQQRAALVERISSGEALIALLRERIRAAEADSGGGDELPALRREALDVSYDLERSRSDLAALDVMQNERASEWRRLLQQAQRRLSDRQAELARLGADMETTLEIRAATDGEIVEVLAGVGTFLHPNDGIYQMTNRVSGLFANAFFSADEAELIEPGMPVQVSLSMLNRQEFGSLRGVVGEVSRFRLSSDALNALLGNRQLVERFSRSGAPLAVEIELSTRADGSYEWTTGRAAPFAVEPGMLVTVSVAIREQRPVTLVVPALLRVLGTS